MCKCRLENRVDFFFRRLHHSCLDEYERAASLTAVSWAWPGAVEIPPLPLGVVVHGLASAGSCVQVTHKGPPLSSRLAPPMAQRPRRPPELIRPKASLWLAPHSRPALSSTARLPLPRCSSRKLLGTSLPPSHISHLYLSPSPVGFYLPRAQLPHPTSVPPLSPAPSHLSRL